MAKFSVFTTILIEFSGFALATIFVFFFLKFAFTQLGLLCNRYVLAIVSTLLVGISKNPAFLACTSILFTLSEFDRVYYRIPDVVTKPVLYLLSLYQLVNFQILLSAWSWITIMYMVTTFAPRSIGRGDIKLIGALILAAPMFINTPPILFLSWLLLLSSIVALPGSLRTKQSADSGLATSGYPFAPAISGAAVLIFGMGAI